MTTPNKIEQHIFRLLLLLLVFLLIAFDRDMALVYSFMILADFVWFLSDETVSFPTSQVDNVSIAMAFFKGTVAYVIFLVATTLIFSAFSSLAVFANFQSIIQLYATSTPILKGSKFLTIIAWGLVIPLIETRFFFGRLFEENAFYGEKLTGIRIPLDRFTIQMVFVILFTAGLFTLFHITSKGLASIPLLITFIFGIVSCILVVMDQELKSAITVHVIANSVAVISSIVPIALASTVGVK